MQTRPCGPTLQTLGELFNVYDQSLIPGVKELSTLKTERIHIAHLSER